MLAHVQGDFMKKLSFIVLLLASINVAAAVPHGPHMPVLPNMDKQITCLARNIYHEAGGESTHGKLAVAQVTMNRVKNTRFPDTICGVVHQRHKKSCQFSWVCAGRVVKNRKLYEESYRIAIRVLIYGERVEALRSALFFHSRAINPKWRRTKVATIGNHVFYR